MAFVIKIDLDLSSHCQRECCQIYKKYSKLRKLFTTDTRIILSTDHTPNKIAQ